MWKIKLNRNDKHFVDACNCLEKRAELLKGLLRQRLIANVTIWCLTLALIADYVFTHGRIFTATLVLPIAGLIWLNSFCLRSDVNAQIKILLAIK